MARQPFFAPRSKGPVLIVNPNGPVDTLTITFDQRYSPPQFSIVPSRPNMQGSYVMGMLLDAMGAVLKMQVEWEQSGGNAQVKTAESSDKPPDLPPAPAS